MPLMEHMDILATTFLIKSYNYPLVVLSLFIAIFASLSAFSAAERVNASMKKSQKVTWNLFGAITMGLGIWAMHFIGMIALRLPITVSYDVSTTLISMIPAICASSVVLWMMASTKHSNQKLFIGGLLLGSGIGSMHYIGMAAMRLQAVMVHDTFLFYLSILVAVVLATGALKIQQIQVINKKRYRFINQGQLFSAVVMGLAVAGMHYIAMASANFSPIDVEIIPSGLASDTLATMVILVMVTILLVAVFIPYLLRYKQISQELNKTLERLDLALVTAKQGWFDIDLVTGTFLVSDEYPRLLGYEPSEFYSNLEEWPKVLHPDDREAVLGVFQKAKTSGKIEEIEYRRKTKEGGWIWLHTVGRVVEWDGKSRPIRAVGVHTDISRSKKQQQQLELMAHYDLLTGLPNRALFIDRFHQAIAHSKRHEMLLAICFIDLDNFKPINDNYGHEVGDKLLIEVAERLKASIREEDTVSRQGGDEFALLLSNIESYSQCEQTLKRLHHSLSEPYLIDGNTHEISASTGLTLYPIDDGDIDTLLRHADQAMYQAKQSGRNRYRFFNSKQDREVVHKHSLLEEVKLSLANNEFQLYYQPKVNMKTGEVLGVEALVRWIHPEKGLIPPLNFLPIIEGTHLEVSFGNWVINEALTQLDYWLKHDFKLEVSINISSYHLQSPTFFEQLSGALEKYPSIESKYLQLEILESSALGDLDAISSIIKRCQNTLGINVALDDFGTGYSSLTHMKSLSANIIKIDRSFVRDVLVDPGDYRIIEGIIGLAQAFDREVIAEGVESDAHGLMLLVMGCEEAQGYGISRPLPANEIVNWLENYKANQCWLDHGSKIHSIQDNKVKLLQLTTAHWFENVNNVILTMQDSGFEEYLIKCHLGTWLARFEHENIFDEVWLEYIKRAHDELFSIASELVAKHQNGDVDGARDGLAEFKVIYEKVCVLFESI